MIDDRLIPWAKGQLERFVLLVNARSVHPESKASVLTLMSSLRSTDQSITSQAAVVERILDRVMPDWRHVVPSDPESRWGQLHEAAVRAMGLLGQQEGLRLLTQHIPQISADQLHPWVWQGARSMWESRHYSQGVVDALKKVQAEAQNKTGRHDLAEVDLFKQLFTTDVPKPGTPRLRLLEDDGSKTFESVHRGAWSLAEGLFAGIRNVVSHTHQEDQGDERRSLEQLAAVSVLARWVDEAVVDEVDSSGSPIGAVNAEQSQ